MKKLFALLLLFLAFVFTPAQQGMGPGPGVKTYGGGGGGPFVSDSYTEGSNTTLASHSPETGGPISLHPSYSGAITVDATLDRIYLTSASSAAYFYNATPASATYCVSADFRRLSLMANNASIAIGMSTTVDTALLLRLNDDGAAQSWDVIDRVSGSSTFLSGVSGVSIPSVGGAAVTAQMCRTGTAVTVFFNGVQNTSLNATTTISTTGKVGLRISGTASSTTGIHLDNLSAQ